MPVAAILFRLAFMAAASFTFGWLAGKVYASTVTAGERVGGGGGGHCADFDDDRRRPNNSGRSPDGATRRRGGGTAAATAEGGGRRRRSGGGLEGLCAVCMQEVATVGFQHGRRVHCCLCRSCWRQLHLRDLTRRCPLCNQEGLCVEVIAT